MSNQKTLTSASMLALRAGCLFRALRSKAAHVAGVRFQEVRMNINFLPQLFFLLLLSTGASADSIKRADVADIDMLLNAASGANSAFWASYIGETRGKIYIQYETAVHAGSSFSNKLKHVVYWVPKAELSDKAHAKFKEYKEKFGSTSGQEI